MRPSGEPGRSTGHDDPVDVLRAARDCLEARLQRHEDWRALCQLDAREDDGDWFDVVEGDTLRDRLVAAVGGLPEFTAWQFVEAAIEALTDSVPAPAPIASPQIVSSASNPIPIAATPTMLAGRIPTLALLDTRLDDKHHHVQQTTDVPTFTAATAASLQPPVRADRPVPISPQPAPIRRPQPVPPPDPAPTQFSAKAASIGEADVEIVRRAPKEPLLDTRLPPSPLTSEYRQPAPPPPTKPGRRLPRTERAVIVKWAEPAPDIDDDYRPVASAMEEAQVAIIPVGDKTVAETRADRRALGVAPDREPAMRRFLSALARD